MKVPKWAVKEIRHWKELLLLHEWETQTQVVANPDEDGTGQTKAVVYLYPNVRIARIDLSDAIPKKLSAVTPHVARSWRKTILHELLHVRFAGLTESVRDDILSELASAARAIADKWLVREVEPLIEIMSEILVEVIKMKPVSFHEDEQTLHPPKGSNDIDELQVLTMLFEDKTIGIVSCW